MEKIFLPLVIAVILLSTIAVTAVGRDHISRNPDQDICVQSRSCAINYMNNLEKDNENQNEQE